MLGKRKTRQLRPFAGAANSFGKKQHNIRFNDRHTKYFNKNSADCNINRDINGNENNHSNYNNNNNINKYVDNNENNHIDFDYIDVDVNFDKSDTWSGNDWDDVYYHVLLYKAKN